jgi:hypothetical protein
LVAKSSLNKVIWHADLRSSETDVTLRAERSDCRHRSKRAVVVLITRQASTLANTWLILALRAWSWVRRAKRTKVACRTRTRLRRSVATEIEGCRCSRCHSVWLKLPGVRFGLRSCADVTFVANTGWCVGSKPTVFTWGARPALADFTRVLVRVETTSRAGNLREPYPSRENTVV